MERLDVALIQSGYAASRQRAKELIQQGSVTINVPKQHAVYQKPISLQ